MEPRTGQMWRFARCAEAFGWTYDQFLDTPDHVIEWVLRMHDLRKAAERRQEQAPSRPPAPFGAPAGMG